MITGDHPQTAAAIARELTLLPEGSDSTGILTGDELDHISDPHLEELLPGIRVFARVSPVHKVRIVQAYRRTGHITAMTGDGVNDAPSLREADIGIAMGAGGTDVARQAADLILTDDNFATITKAIEEGRSIYENICKTVLFLLSSNFGEIITMFFCVLCRLEIPLSAIHILWINLITDSLPALALGMDKNDRTSLMRRPPRSGTESLMAGGGWFCTVFYGFFIAAISLFAFLTIPYLFLKQSDLPFSFSLIREVLAIPAILIRAQTYAFTTLGISQLFPRRRHERPITFHLCDEPLGESSNDCLLLSWFPAAACCHRTFTPDSTVRHRQSGSGGMGISGFAVGHATVYSSDFLHFYQKIEQSCVFFRKNPRKAQDCFP